MVQLLLIEGLWVHHWTCKSLRVSVSDSFIIVTTVNTSRQRKARTRHEAIPYKHLHAFLQLSIICLFPYQFFALIALPRIIHSSHVVFVPATLLVMQLMVHHEICHLHSLASTQRHLLSPRHQTIQPAPNTSVLLAKKGDQITLWHISERCAFFSQKLLDAGVAWHSTRCCPNTQRLARDIKGNAKEWVLVPRQSQSLWVF